MGQEESKSQCHASYDQGSDAAFIRGFVTGQASAYIEQVVAGAKLAAQIGCSKEHVQEIVALAARDNCEAVVEDRPHHRAAIWIFRAPFVRAIIQEFSQNATPPTAAGVWAMGKLFGYSDSAIDGYLREHGLIKSVSDSESNQRPCSDNSCLRTEPARCAY